MNLQELDKNKLAKLTSQQIDHVTCIECCKFFCAPTTGICGHTLCRTCWLGRHKCPCGVDNDKVSLRLNLPLQKLTKCVQKLLKKFEVLFDIKLEEYLLHSPSANEIEQDPSKNVSKWLDSSQNHFSVPPTNSEQLTQDTSVYMELVTSHAQVHSSNKTKPVLMEIEHVPPKEQDWDRIEEMPEDDSHKNKENVVGPMDIEPFDDDYDKEFTPEKPRRSFRNKENNSKNISNVSNDIVNNVNCNSVSSMDTNKKSNKTLKSWNNVKKMKKDLNKIKTNKNKLNVSVEMCKKVVPSKAVEAIDSQVIYTIDDNTPEVTVTETNKVNDYTTVKESNGQSITDKNDLCGDNIVSNMSMLQKKARLASVDSLPRTKEKDKLLKNNNELNTKMDKHSQNNLNGRNALNDVERKVTFFKKSTFVNNNKYNKRKSESKCIGNNVPCVVNTDDIEITIKMGDTVANIFIKKKENDVQVNVQSDREVQTSLRDSITQGERPVEDDLQVRDKTSQSQIDINVRNVTDPSQSTAAKTDLNNIENKSASTKKHTASADTVTAEITATVEKELLLTMGNKRTQQEVIQPSVKSNSQALREIEADVAVLNDLDLFDSQSVKEGHVQSLKDTKGTPSAILLPTYKSSTGKQRLVEKRNRDNDENEVPNTKKRKGINNKNDVTIEEDSLLENVQKANSLECSEMDNYNDIISQVFANIDADINHMQKNKTENATQSSVKSIKRKENVITTQKYSENVFSIHEKDSTLEDTSRKQDVPEESQKSTHGERNGTTEINTSKRISPKYDSDLVVDNTPAQDETLSGQSVVEETPQKFSSFSKIRTRSSVTANTSKNAEITKGRHTLETPGNINKFVDEIKNKSTPIARKSLDFHAEDADDQTVCSSFAAAKTTQEKEFMSKAFEQTYSPSRTLVPEARDAYCIAGSCLSAPQQLNLKKLCALKGWTFTDTYTKELTHLVVGVDEENRAQRSVKFMLALAAGRWIVSYGWVARCLQGPTVAAEEAWEARDGTGAAGPRRARLRSAAGRRLFAGLRFTTLPPFSVLTQQALQEMLVSAGGTLAAEGAAGGGAPVLLLAEPEHTQEDRFMYLAMERGVVPVNYEWALNCLGGYSLTSVYELLLCPAALLPKAVDQWPPELTARDDD